MDRRPFIFKLRNVKTAFAKHGILTDNEPILFVLPADTTVLVLSSQKCGKNMIDNFVLSPDGQAGVDRKHIMKLLSITRSDVHVFSQSNLFFLDNKSTCILHEGDFVLVLHKNQRKKPFIDDPTLDTLILNAEGQVGWVSNIDDGSFDEVGQ